VANTPTPVTLHIWGVTPAHVPGAIMAMAVDRPSVRRMPGLSFAKLLGTGSGRTFTASDADVHHWAMLGVWTSAEDLRNFEGSPLHRRWLRRSCEQLRVELEPLASTGRWAGRQPFDVAAASPCDGPVAALTRARLKPRLARSFWAAVPPVVQALHGSAGLVLSLGIGEAPIGLQGTFSIWRSADDLATFAYRNPDHRRVIKQTKSTGWYAEELFARFTVRSVSGTYRGEPVVL